MLRLHTKPCHRYIYIRHVQTRKNVIEQAGDMTTTPLHVELTDEGRYMASCIFNGIRSYLERKGCDPAGAQPRLASVDYDDDEACRLTHACVAPLLQPDNPGGDVSVVVRFCTVPHIRQLLASVGIPADCIGVPLGSATIVDKLYDGTFFVHAVGDLGIAPQYPVSKINYWNNAP
jgi:hypothetical protein